MKKSSLISDFSGFSILEAIVAVGLLAIVLMAGLSLSTSISKSSKDMAGSALEFQDVVGQVNSILTSDESCRRSIGGYMNYDTTTVDSQIQTISVPGGANPIILYKPITPRSAATRLIDPGDTTKSADPYTGVMRQTYRQFGIWEVEELTVRPINPPFVASAVNPALLRIKMNNTTVGAGTSKRTSVDLKFSIELDATMNIIRCFPLTYSTTSSVPRCNDPNYALTSLGSKIVCRKFKCPGNVASTGIAANGDVICP